jgi:hypothetical protein
MRNSHTAREKLQIGLWLTQHLHEHEGKTWDQIARACTTDTQVQMSGGNLAYHASALGLKKPEAKPIDVWDAIRILSDRITLLEEHINAPSEKG